MSEEVKYTRNEIIKILDAIIADQWQCQDGKWETDEGDITSEKLFDEYLKPKDKK